MESLPFFWRGVFLDLHSFGESAAECEYAAKYFTE